MENVIILFIFFGLEPQYAFLGIFHPENQSCQFKWNLNPRLIRSWGKGMDCRVHPLKYLWISQKRLTARIWDFLTFNIYYLWPSSQHFRSVSLLIKIIVKFLLTSAIFRGLSSVFLIFFFHCTRNLSQILHLKKHCVMSFFSKIIQFLDCPPTLSIW